MDIEGNEMADRQAKEAAREMSAPGILTTNFRQQISS